MVRDRDDIVRVPANLRAPDMPHAGGRLFQQYCVDAFTRIEAERTGWCRNNQQKLRCEQLSGLMDYVHGLDTSAQNPIDHRCCHRWGGIRSDEPLGRQRCTCCNDLGWHR